MISVQGVKTEDGEDEIWGLTHGIQWGKDAGKGNGKNNAAGLGLLRGVFAVLLDTSTCYSLLFIYW